MSDRMISAILWTFVLLAWVIAFVFVVPFMVWMQYLSVKIACTIGFEWHCRIVQLVEGVS